MHMHIKYLGLLAIACYILRASVMNNVRTWIDRWMLRVEINRWTVVDRWLERWIGLGIDGWLGIDGQIGCTYSCRWIWMQGCKFGFSFGRDTSEFQVLIPFRSSTGVVVFFGGDTDR